MLSFPAAYAQPPREPSPLPRRGASLSSSIAKPKPSSPLLQSGEDARSARVLLDTPPIAAADEEHAHERELTEMLARMTSWVEELSALLHQAYKNQTELETALTLTRSNLQLALANNEMLEEALKRGGTDVGWRRWSEREGLRRTGSVKEYAPHVRPSSGSVVEAPSGPSRFFGFKSPLQRSTSPTEPTLLPSISIPDSRSPTPAPPPPPSGAPGTPSTPATAGSSAAGSSTSFVTAASSTGAKPRARTPSPSSREKELAGQLEKERAARALVARDKAALEDELESLSQALFEEANKMVAGANRKLAETEEELRVAVAQKEALQGALRIVEGENGELRERGTVRELETEPEPEPELQPEPEPELQPQPSPPSQDTIPAPHPPPRSPQEAPSLNAPPHALATSSMPTPIADTPAAATDRAVGHRWSVMPHTPRARNAVRTEFEDAMRRMRDLVSEGAGEGGVREEVEGGAGAGEANPWRA